MTTRFLNLGTTSLPPEKSVSWTSILIAFSRCMLFVFAGSHSKHRKEHPSRIRGGEIVGLRHAIDLAIGNSLHVRVLIVLYQEVSKSVNSFDKCVSNTTNISKCSIHVIVAADAQRMCVIERELVYPSTCPTFSFEPTNFNLVWSKSTSLYYNQHLRSSESMMHVLDTWSASRPFRRLVLIRIRWWEILLLVGHSEGVLPTGAIASKLPDTYNYIEVLMWFFILFAVTITSHLFLWKR